MEGTCPRCGRTFRREGPADEILCPGCRGKKRPPGGPVDGAGGADEDIPKSGDEDEELDDFIIGGSLGFFDDVIP